MELPNQISAIAQLILQDWQDIYFGALPYLNAMFALNDINDRCEADSAKTAVHYFLANAQSWRGEKARAVKKHLNQLLKEAQ